MNKFQTEVIDKIVHTSNTYNKKSRQAAYARVSTDNDEQRTSYANQLRHYEEKIKSDSSAIFVGIYADEAISGANAEKRPGFMEMVEDVRANKIDVIHVKNISRFARNTIDTLNYIREFKSFNVAVIFEEENINTLDLQGEFMLTILSSVAQQELQNTSDHVKAGLQIKMKNGELVGSCAPFGYIYDKENNDLLIDEEKSLIVKLIFDLRIKGYGSRRIANYLNDKNIPSPTNGKWGYSTITNMLKNEKYKGALVQGKRFITDPISKKVKNNRGEQAKFSTQNRFKNHIIEPSDFDYVQDLMNGNAKKFGNTSDKNKHTLSRKYPFTQKVECGFCHKNYIRRINSPGKVAWGCSRKIEQGRASCEESKYVLQSDLEDMFIDLCNTYINLKDNKIIDEIMNDVQEVLVKQDNDIDCNQMQKEIDQLNKQKQNLVSALTRGLIDENEFSSERERIKSEIEGKYKKIEQSKQKEAALQSISERLDNIYKILKKSELKNFDQTLFENVIDHIEVGSVDMTGKKNVNNIKFILSNDDMSKKEIEFHKKSISDSTDTFKNPSNVTTDSWNIPASSIRNSI